MVRTVNSRYTTIIGFRTIASYSCSAALNSYPESFCDLPNSKRMYLTHLQENFKPVAHRSASVEVFDEEDAQVVHLPPSYWDIGDSKELEVEDAMDA